MVTATITKKPIDKMAVAETRLKNPCATQQQIGDKFGVSRERIRQVLNELKLPTSAVIVPRLIKCLSCGKPTTNRRFCSPKCLSDYTYMKIPCEICGKLRRYRIKWVLWEQDNRGTQKHFFCSRRCFGKWLSANYGFGVCPEHRRYKNISQAD